MQGAHGKQGDPEGESNGGRAGKPVGTKSTYSSFPFWHRKVSQDIAVLGAVFQHRVII